jgi:hypothetical protein
MDSDKIPEYKELERLDTVNDHREAVKMAYRIYATYYRRAWVLEVLACHEALTVKELRGILVKLSLIINEEVWHKDSVQVWDLTMLDLSRLGSLSSNGAEDPLEAKFSITDEGLKSMREGTFFNLANSAFFGYRSLILGQQGYEVSKSALEVSKSSHKLSKIALCFTATAVLIAVFSIVLTLCR